MNEGLRRKLDTLPDGPGVYLWKDAAGGVLYVGKAANLRSRVRSYFAADFPDSPTRQLFRDRIADVGIRPEVPGARNVAPPGDQHAGKCLAQRHGD